MNQTLRCSLPPLAPARVQAVAPRPAEQASPAAPTGQNDDAVLIAQTLEGDTVAFGHLACKYQNRLYNAMVHRTGDAEDARDVVQEALMQALLHLKTFRHASSFYTWLHRIAFNIRVTRLRRKHATVSVERMQEETGQEPADRSLPPDEELQRAERRQQVRQAIGRLSEEHREVVLLRDIEGFTYEEIAAILALPVGTVRSRLFRARMHLRDLLAPPMTAG